MRNFPAVLLLALCMSHTAWSQTKDTSPPLVVSRTQGPDGGTLTSERQREDGTLVLHGLQLKYGPRLQIREYSVYHEGELEQLYQMFPNGNAFRVVHRQANGDGDEVVYSAAASKTVAEKLIVGSGQDIGPIKTQEVLAQGTIKKGQRHHGTFLVRELQGFQFHWLKQEFKDGQVVKSEPFPIDKLDLKEIPGADADEHWPWTIPDWPAAGRAAR
jgi:hypothetical protein